MKAGAVGGADPNDDYDGGWTAALDHGGKLADLMLGPAHPHDRDDQYTPARRWGTRHSLKSQPFADPGELVDSGVARQTRRSGPGAAGPATARGRKITSSPRKVTAKPAVAAKPAVVAKSQKALKAERTTTVASALGLSIAELTDLRRRYGAAVTQTPGSDRTMEALARHMGVCPNELTRFLDAEGQKPASRKATAKPKAPAKPVKGLKHAKAPRRARATSSRFAVGERPGSAAVLLRASANMARLASRAALPLSRLKGSGFERRPMGAAPGACQSCGCPISTEGRCGCS